MGIIIYSIITAFPFIVSYALQGKEMIPILKILLCFAPILNISVTFDILHKYHILKNFPLSIIKMRINGVSYLINILILIFEALINISIIILKRKSEKYGLTIYSFIKFHLKNLCKKKNNSFNLIENNDIKYNLLN